MIAILDCGLLEMSLLPRKEDGVLSKGQDTSCNCDLIDKPHEGPLAGRTLGALPATVHDM
jgi:hypothetical protein